MPKAELEILFNGRDLVDLLKHVNEYISQMQVAIINAVEILKDENLSEGGKAELKILAEAMKNDPR